MNDKKWLYIRIFKEGEKIDGENFTPWLCKAGDKLEDIFPLAINVFMRESGYQSPGVDFKPFEITVAGFTPDMINPKTQKPKSLKAETYIIRKPL